MTIWWILFIALGMGIWLIYAYNRIQRSIVAVDSSWGQVEVQLQRRSDLIPNLVSVVKGYAAHERELFERVTMARAAATATNVDEANGSQSKLAGGLSSLMMIAESYPELKANESFVRLQTELSTTEERLSYTRAYFNERTQAYNVLISTLPTALVAKALKCAPKHFLTADAVELPKVDFS